MVLEIYYLRPLTYNIFENNFNQNCGTLCSFNLMVSKESYVMVLIYYLKTRYEIFEVWDPAPFCTEIIEGFA